MEKLCQMEKKKKVVTADKRRESAHTPQRVFEARGGG